MRYRLRTSGLEFVVAIIPFIDGVRDLLHPESHTYHGVGSLWHIVYPCLLLSTPLILVLRYWYSYVELTPSSLEYQDAWRHRSIPYSQIERIESETGSGAATEIRVSGMKNLSLKLDRTEDFLIELRQYAPLAFVEAVVTQ